MTIRGDFYANAILLDAEGLPQKHEQGVIQAAKILRDHINITTMHTVSVAESEYMVRDILRGYLAEQR